MNNLFSEMFSKQPDEIIKGDYFYHVDWFNKIYGLTEKEKTHHENIFLGNWIANIQECTGSPELINISKKIVAEQKPIMDISCGINMGLIPYIAKLNPNIPCLVTDIDYHLIKCWRTFKDSTIFSNNVQFVGYDSDVPLVKCWHPFKDYNLSNYNIHFASFDNFDMPIKDNSLDYITSNLGICSSFSEKNVHRSSMIAIDSEKVIREVYRILKPGGCFVTVEVNYEWNFNLSEVYKEYKLHGKLFGIYDFNEIKIISEIIKKESLHDKFISEGFEIEAEKVSNYNSEKITTAEIKVILDSLADSYKVCQWTDKERQSFFLPHNKDNLSENFGITCTEGRIFYVLRKP